MKTTLIKGLATVQVVFAAAAFVFSDESWVATSIRIAGGLALFFLSNEKINDERVAALKLKALTIAFVIAYGLAVTDRMVAVTELIRGLPTIISAFDFTSIVIGVACALFYYWRWQDARPPKSEIN